jgi:hypothetical protein
MTELSAQPLDVPRRCSNTRGAVPANISITRLGYTMPNATTDHGRLRDLMLRLLRGFGQRLYANDDLRADQHGWQVTHRRGGLSRTYRDPRFDQFRGCAECGGTGAGWRAGQTCGSCNGTGRIWTTYRATNVGER